MALVLVDFIRDVNYIRTVTWPAPLGVAMMGFKLVLLRVALVCWKSLPSQRLRPHCTESIAILEDVA